MKGKLRVLKFRQTQKVKKYLHIRGLVEMRPPLPITDQHGGNVWRSGGQVDVT